MSSTDRTKSLALCGIALAFVIVCMRLASIIPGGDNVMVLLAGFAVFLVTRLRGLKWGSALYIAGVLTNVFFTLMPAAIMFDLPIGITALLLGTVANHRRLGMKSFCAVFAVSITLLTNAAMFIFKKLFIGTIRDSFFDSFGISADSLIIFLYATIFGIVTGILGAIIFESFSLILAGRLGMKMISPAKDSSEDVK